MKVELKNISDILNNTENIYAHKKCVKGIVNYETLIEHSDRAISYFNVINKNKNIIKIVGNIVDNMLNDYGIEKNEEIKNFVVNMFVNAIYLHDLGKSNPAFQYYAMDNKAFGKVICEKNHSLLSALMFTDIYIKEVKNKFGNKGDVAQKLYVFVAAFAYIISRHHSKLEDVNISKFGEEMSDLAVLNSEMLINYKDKIYEPEKLKNRIRNKVFRNQSRYMYVLTKLLFSLLVTCDFASTFEYMNGCKAQVVNEINKKDLTDKYNNRALIKNIRENKNNVGINKLRTDIFLESEKNLKNNWDKNIYYMESPTGSGKTNTSINVALSFLNNIADMDSIFYIFPFNTLAEQTAEVMEFWEKDKDFVVMNSNTPIAKNIKDENTEYENIYFNYQLANYPIVITSHIRLFEALFGTGREKSIWLYKLCNGVIILDEIQSYRCKMWHFFINILNDYCEMLNIKVVIMSATLPRLSNLIRDDVSKSIFDLIDCKKYFNNEIFKNRVKVDFSMVKYKIDIKELAKNVLKKYNEDKHKNILVEFIKKSSAREFYNILKDLCRDKDIAIAELSGDDNKAVRKKIISDIKNRKIDIVVATQVIEAGVDISMDIGYKDISTIDSEEQFMGRINRSCLSAGFVYFFDMDDEKSIYRGDERTNYTLRSEEMQKILVDKNFESYYKYVLEEINKNSNSTDYNKNLTEFRVDLSTLKYKEVKNKLKLIDNNSFQIVLNYECEIDGATYKGCEIWQEYKNLLADSKNMGYGELKIKMSNIREKLDIFTFNIIGIAEKAEIHNVTEKIGDLFYFENGYDFITDEGKFDREKFNRENGSAFL